MAWTTRLSVAAGLGALAGASPFAAFVLLSEEHPYVRMVSRNVSRYINAENRRVWVRGDARPHRIIILRHGQTHGYSHTCDCQVAGLPVCALKPEYERPLTEEGKLQALQAGVALKQIIGNETVTFISSPYKSCKQTFQYVAGSFEAQGCNYVEDPRLRNQDFGNWHLSQPPELAAEYAEQSKKLGKFYFRWPGGESTSEVYDRISSFMETMYRKWQHPELRPDNWVLVTHGVVAQTFLMRWFHWDVDTLHRLKKFKNGQLAVMEKQDDGSYRLITPLQCDPPIPNGVKILAAKIQHDSVDDEDLVRAANE